MKTQFLTRIVYIYITVGMQPSFIKSDHQINYISILVTVDVQKTLHIITGITESLWDCEMVALLLSYAYANYSL